MAFSRRHMVFFNVQGNSLSSRSVRVRYLLFKRVTSFALAASMFAAALGDLRPALAAELSLPAPTALMQASAAHELPTLTGMSFDAKDPARIRFLFDSNDEQGVEKAVAEEALRYFLAALALPEQALWVNLSPREPDRVIDATFATTELGRGFLEQDYLLKLFSASLTKPDTTAGKAYWAAVGDADLSKIWIAPKTAAVYEQGDRVLITAATLKPQAKAESGATATDAVSGLLPAVEREINSGRSFAQLRQMYRAVILARWFKERVRDAAVKRYAGSATVTGIDTEDAAYKEQVWQRYCRSFEKGVYDQVTRDPSAPKTKRRYIAGGIGWQVIPRQSSPLNSFRAKGHLVECRARMSSSGVAVFDEAVQEKGQAAWFQSYERALKSYNAFIAAVSVLPFDDNGQAIYTNNGVSLRVFRFNGFRGHDYGFYREEIPALERAFGLKKHEKMNIAEFDPQSQTKAGLQNLFYSGYRSGRQRFNEFTERVVGLPFDSNGIAVVRDGNEQVRIIRYKTSGGPAAFTYGFFSEDLALFERVFGLERQDKPVVSTDDLTGIAVFDQENQEKFSLTDFRNRYRGSQSKWKKIVGILAEIEFDSNGRGVYVSGNDRIEVMRYRKPNMLLSAEDGSDIGLYGFVRADKDTFERVFGLERQTKEELGYVADFDPVVQTNVGHDSAQDDYVSGSKIHGQFLKIADGLTYDDRGISRYTQNGETVSVLRYKAARGQSMYTYGYFNDEQQKFERAFGFERRPARKEIGPTALFDGTMHVVANTAMFKNYSGRRSIGDVMIEKINDLDYGTSGIATYSANGVSVQIMRFPGTYGDSEYAYGFLRSEVELAEKAFGWQRIERENMGPVADFDPREQVKAVYDAFYHRYVAGGNEHGRFLSIARCLSFDANGIAWYSNNGVSVQILRYKNPNGNKYVYGYYQKNEGRFEQVFALRKNPQDISPEEVEQLFSDLGVLPMVDALAWYPDELSEALRVLTDLSDDEIAQDLRVYSTLGLSESQGGVRRASGDALDALIDAAKVRAASDEGLSDDAESVLLGLAERIAMRKVTQQGETAVLEQIMSRAEEDAPWVERLYDRVEAHLARMRTQRIDHVTTPLLPHQRDGVLALREHAKFALFDEARTGKTLTVLAALDPAEKTLILAPAQVLDIWRSEIARHTTLTNVVALRGTLDEKHALAESVRGKRGVIVLASIEDYLRDPSYDRAAVEGTLDTVIFDESQFLSNYYGDERAHNAMQAQAAQSIAAKRTWALSATPFHSKPEQLFALYSMLFSDGMDFAAFRERYCTDSKGLIDLYAKLAQVSLRRIKKDVYRVYDEAMTAEEKAFSIPALTEEDVSVPMTAAQTSAMIDLMAEKSKRPDADESEGPLSFFSIAQKAEDLWWADGSPAWQALDDAVQPRVAAGKKGIVYAFNVNVTDSIVARYRAQYGEKAVAVMNGDSEKTEELARFQNDPACKIVVMSVQSGIGIDVTAAEWMVYAQQPKYFSQYYQTKERPIGIDAAHVRANVESIQLVPTCDAATVAGYAGTEKAAYAKAGSMQALALARLCAEAAQFMRTVGADPINAERWYRDEIKRRGEAGAVSSSIANGGIEMGAFDIERSGTGSAATNEEAAAGSAHGYVFVIEAFSTVVSGSEFMGR